MDLSDDTKIVHWEFIKDNIGEVIGKPDVKLKVIRIQNHDTKKVVGLRFRYIIHAQSIKGHFLACIIENNFQIDDLADIYIIDLRTMFIRSYNRAQAAIIKQVESEGIKRFIIYFDVPDTVLQKLLHILKGL